MIQSLYAVVVNWNLKQDTLACVESLLAAGAASSHVIVVDNGSTDGSVLAFRERFGPSIEVLASSENLGFAGAGNLGIKHALEQGAHWVLLLNNDTLVASTFLAELEKAAQSDERFAVWGPLILYQSFPHRIWYSGDRLIPGLLATLSIHHGQTDQGQLPPLVPVDFVSGCGMLMRRDVFDTIGFFDTSFFMYGEDVDICWRARAAGFRLAVATRAKMWHKVSASSNRDRPISRYLRIRNQNRIYRTYARRWQLPLMIGFTCLRALRIALGDLIHGQVMLIGPLVLGWVHGWQNRQDPVGYGV